MSPGEKWWQMDSQGRVEKDFLSRHPKTLLFGRGCQMAEGSLRTLRWPLTCQGPRVDLCHVQCSGFSEESKYTLISGPLHLFLPLPGRVHCSICSIQVSFCIGRLLSLFDTDCCVVTSLWPRTCLPIKGEGSHFLVELCLLLAVDGVTFCAPIPAPVTGCGTWKALLSIC